MVNFIEKAHFRIESAVAQSSHSQPELLIMKDDSPKVFMAEQRLIKKFRRFILTFLEF